MTLDFLGIEELLVTAFFELLIDVFNFRLETLLLQLDLILSFQLFLSLRSLPRLISTSDCICLKSLPLILSCLRLANKWLHKDLGVAVFSDSRTVLLAVRTLGGDDRGPQFSKRLLKQLETNRSRLLYMQIAQNLADFVLEFFLFNVDPFLDVLELCFN